MTIYYSVRTSRTMFISGHSDVQIELSPMEGGGGVHVALTDGKGDDLIWLDQQLIDNIHGARVNHSIGNGWIRDDLDEMGLEDVPNSRRYAQVRPNGIYFHSERSTGAVYDFTVLWDEFEWAFREMGWMLGRQSEQAELASAGVKAANDMSRFPHKCPKCGKPCYIGFMSVDHFGICSAF